MDSDWYSATSNDTITLEPRLLEYLKKKKHYIDSHIPIDNLEQNYQITDADLNTIRAYLRGDKKKYNVCKYTDYVNPTSSQFDSQKQNLHKDPRFERIKKKQQRDKDAKDQRNNYSMVERTYDMYRKEQNLASAAGNDFESTGDWMLNTKDLSKYDDNPYKVPPPEPLGSTFYGSNSYNESTGFGQVAPKIRLDDYLPYGSIELPPEDYTLDNILKELNSKKKFTDRTYTYEPKSFDTQYSTSATPKTQNRPPLPPCSKPEKPRKKLTPEEISCIMSGNWSPGSGQPIGAFEELDDGTIVPRENIQKKPNTPKYIPENKRDTQNPNCPQSTSMRNDSRDISLDTFLRYGGNTPTRNAKTLGYPNPFEHSFNYINDDMQKPEHVVNDRGFPSRSLNREVARPGLDPTKGDFGMRIERRKKRDVMM